MTMRESRPLPMLNKSNQLAIHISINSVYFWTNEMRREKTLSLFLVSLDREASVTIDDQNREKPNKL